MSNKRPQRDEHEQAEDTLPTPRTPTRTHQKRARTQEEEEIHTMLHDADTPPVAIKRSLFYQIIEDIDKEHTRIHAVNKEIDEAIHGIIQHMPHIHSP